MKLTILSLSLTGVALPAAVLISACGGSDEDGYSQLNTNPGGSSTTGAQPGAAAAVVGAGAGNTGGVDLSGGTASGTTGTVVMPEPVTGCDPGPDAAGCVGVNYEGETVPLDIYVMFDLSCSMSCSVENLGCCRNSENPDPLEAWRIQPVREAMRTFLQDPASAGIGVGLGFFGDHDVDDPNNPQVCSLEGHSDATVDIAPLPGNAATLIGQLDAGEPQGGTPTHLAIDGACAYSASWKAANPSHKVVILLVTDGIPEHSCSADIEQATDSAETCYADGAGFETYVLGVVANNNNSLQQLNGIAEAGGTTQAYLTDSNDIAGSVLAALNAIRADAAIPCDLQIPPPPSGEVLNPTLVSVGICDPAGQVVPTPYVESEGACAGSPGWYYDDPLSPQAIHLCDVTCETVSAAGSSLFFNVGCARDVQVF